MVFKETRIVSKVCSKTFLKSPPLTCCILPIVPSQTPHLKTCVSFPLHLYRFLPSPRPESWYKRVEIPPDFLKKSKKQNPYLDLRFPSRSVFLNCFTAELPERVIPTCYLHFFFLFSISRSLSKPSLSLFDVCIYIYTSEYSPIP